MSTQMSSGGLQLVESQSGKTIEAGWQNMEVASREIKRHGETTRCQCGICPSSMCIVFGDDTQKRRSSHLAMTGERPKMIFSVA